jgi:hypothetical protein
MLHKDYYRNGSAEKSLVVSVKGLDAKTNWFAVNRQSSSNLDFEFGFDNELAVRRTERLSSDGKEVFMYAAVTVRL